MHLSAKREVSGMLSHQCYPFLITLSDCEAHWSFNVFRYGRYRPWGIPISKRPLGWQIQWWHYAQNSVLSDVRKRMKKTSWK